MWGIIRRSSDINTQRIDHLYQNKNLILKYGDLTDSANLGSILNEIYNFKDNKKIEVLEVYNLAALSHVKVSFEMPEYTGNVDGLGTLRLLEAIDLPLISRHTFYQGFYFRTIWSSPGNSTKRNYTFLPPFTLCCSQTLCLLDC